MALLDESKRVQILDFGARAEFFLAAGAHRHIGIAAERTLLHVAVADLQVAHQRVDLFHVRHRLLGRAHVGLGDDFEQRRAGAIQVDAAGVGQALMQGLAGILLQMRASDADGLDGAVIEHDVELAALHHGQFVLADLIALRQIGVEIILAREHRAARDFRPDAQTEFDRPAKGFGVQHRQHGRICQIDQVRLGVRRRRAVSRRRAGKNLRLRCELGVYLQPDDYFPVAHCSYPRGDRTCQSVAVWNRCAAFSSLPSEKCGPISCRPMGNPSTNPQGSDSPGRPARLTPMV